MRIVTLLLALGWLCLYTPVTAIPFFGSHIEYASLGNDSFEITLTTYRDCSGIPIPDHTLTFNSLCSPTIDKFTVKTALVSGTDVTPKCATTQSRCANSGSNWPYGFQKVVSKACVSLKNKSCCQYRISWTMSGRLYHTTIEESNYYIEATLDRCLPEANNSPRFHQIPPLVVRQGLCVEHWLGIQDPDGDLLTYHLVAPETEPGVPVKYKGSYNANEPLSYEGSFGDPNLNWDQSCKGFHLDTLTGMIRFKGTREENAEFGIMVKEYRRNSSGSYQLIGTSTSFFNVIVKNIPNQTNNRPSIITISNLANHVAVGDTLCVSGKGVDPDGDSVTLAFSSNIPGSSASYSSDKYPTGDFCVIIDSSHIRETPWHFTLKATDAKCPLPDWTTELFTVQVHTSVFAQFNAPDKACAGDTVEFLNKSLLYNRQVWYFGDGDSSTLESPSHLYMQPGTYTVKLKVWDADNNVSETEKQITVCKVASAAFSMPQILCAGELYNLEPADTTAKAYVWSLNNSVTVQERSIMVKYTTPGQYSITLNAISEGGCFSASTVSFEVHDMPAPVLKPVVQNCTGMTVNVPKPFAYDSASHYLWNWGDGQTDTGFYTQHTYSQSGTYTVTLTVTNAAGCSATDTTTVDLQGGPVADFSMPAQVCEGEAVSFTNASTGASSYSWSFGSGSAVSSAHSPSFTYSSPGTYTVTLKATGASGCMNLLSKTIEVLARPDLIIDTPSSVCVGDTFTLNVSSQSSTSLKWYVDGQLVSTNTSSISYLPDTAGLYPVAVAGTTAAGCYDSVATNIRIYDKPSAAFTYAITDSLTVAFFGQDSSTDLYLWRFGDKDSTATGKVRSHTYADYGTYIVSLTVMNPNGCIYTTTDTVELKKALGIQNKAEFGQWKAWPNPFEKELYIEFALNKPAQLELGLYDMQGRKLAAIAQGSYRADTYRYTFSPQEAGLMPGTYLLRAVVDGQMLHERVLYVQ